MLYAAIAVTLLVAFKLGRSWGTAVGMAFGILNALVIFLFPAGKMIGTIIGGMLLYLLRDSGSGSSDAGDPPAA